MESFQKVENCIISGTIKCTVKQMVKNVIFSKITFVYRYITLIKIDNHP